MNCPYCDRALLPTAVHIGGLSYRIVKRTVIPRHYVDIGSEMLYCRPVPLVVVKRIGTALKSKPLTESLTEQP